MINIAEVIENPDFTQAITIQRSSGSFELGGWQNALTSVFVSAVVTVATAQDLSQVPQGDRVTGAMTFYSTEQIFQTHADGSPGTSDTIWWRGQQYRVAQVWPYADYGYWKALGLRISGE